jgi:transposase-like protein
VLGQDGILKRSKRVPLFNDQIISMYAHGMADQQIKEHLDRVYNIDVSRDLVSVGMYAPVTDAVLEDVGQRSCRGMAEPPA